MTADTTTPAGLTAEEARERLTKWADAWPSYKWTDAQNDALKIVLAALASEEARTNPDRELLEAAKDALYTLTADDACDLDPIVGSDNPHEDAAGRLKAAIQRAEAGGAVESVPAGELREAARLRASLLEIAAFAEENRTSKEFYPLAKPVHCATAKIRDMAKSALITGGDHAG